MAGQTRFHVTKHASLRIAERGLSLESMKSVILSSSSDVKLLNRGPHGGHL